MIVTINKKANFWIRLLATIIDLILFVVFALATSFIVFNYKKADFYTNQLLYKELIYRFWLLSLILFLVLTYIVFPILTKGKTIGMLICKIKVILTNKNIKLSKAIFDRQRLFSFLWIFVFIAFMLMSTDAFLKATRGKNLNNVEKVVFALPVTLATIALGLDLFMIITGAGATRVSWNDKFSQTRTVWINKFEEIIEEENINKKIYPKKRELPNISIL
ncbi:hypothetical protein DMC14_003050 [Metamycoplasma phocicerebrale]|uniref:RDD domain-containing protein n=1 Tax=Metamycoplasma phocicerebrale TaxID=142649 RepID=A0A3Q9VBR7_9BACT|nr:RDD family protein [Metamycoplasma phocicerebrale]AZZ65742.1 hypothetical protein DMC14_003050 [Metamycoplasma phocicerebrale]